MIASKSRKFQYALVSTAAVLLSAQFASAANITITQNSTQTFAAINGAIGNVLTMGTNGHLVINGIATDTVSTFDSLAAGGTPNRGTANLLINSNAASNTVVDFKVYNFTPNKTDILMEGRNIGGTGADTTQFKFTTTAPTLYGAAAGITGINATILVHDLATGSYNLATYDAATGIRGLSTSNANDYAIDTLTANANVLLTASQANGAALTVNSLTLRNTGTGVDLSGANVTLPSYGSGAGANGILSDGTVANTISVGTLRANATDGLTIHTVADLTISSSVLAGWLVKANAGKLTLSGANNFNGTVAGGSPAINISGGILSVSNDGNLGANSNIITFVGGGIEFNASTVFHHVFRTYEADTALNTVAVTSGNTAELAAAITNDSGGGGGITYVGPGKVILSAANTYIGPSRITAGTVVANNNAALSANTSVSGGAVLQVNNGITVSPASFVLTLLASNSKLIVGTDGATGTSGETGALTASNGGTFDFDFNGTATTDTFAVSGTVTAGGTFTINLNDLGGSSVVGGTPYTLLSGGTFTGTPTLVGNVTSANWQLDTSYDGDGLLWDPTSNTLTAQFVAAAPVPEPASLAVLGLGAVALLSRRRKD